MSDSMDASNTSQDKLVVETKDLTKAWGDIVAVDHVTFHIKEGEIFGMLGPNGAGKTTTIKLLCTLLSPTGGSATVAGFDVSKNPEDVRRVIGYVPQDITVDGRLTAKENLDLQAALYGIKGKDKDARIEKMLKLVQLNQRSDGLVDMFSGGMRRRLEIARGLLVEPSLLLLDEPSVGLDPVSRKSIWEHVSKLKRKYKNKFAIFMSTHYMEEADRLCDRIAIIDRGRIVALDTPTNLKKAIGGQFIELDVDAGKTGRTIKKLEQSSGQKFMVKITELNNTTISIEVKDIESTIPKVFKITTENNIDVKQVRMHSPTLEDVFIHHTGRSLRDEDANDPMSFMKSMISKRLRSV